MARRALHRALGPGFRPLRDGVAHVPAQIKPAQQLRTFLSRGEGIGVQAEGGAAARILKDDEGVGAEDGDAGPIGFGLELGVPGNGNVLAEARYLRAALGSGAGRLPLRFRYGGGRLGSARWPAG